MKCLSCNTDKVSHLSDTPVSNIISKWQQQYKLDVMSCFSSVSQAHYICNECELEFFIPPSPGDDSFYDSIQEFDWYYEESKWEFKKALDFLNKDDRIVEIGSGEGRFVEYLKDRGYRSVFAIDKNEKAIEKATKKGLIAATNIDELGISEADVVCSFQVLEHVSEVRAFVSDICDICAVGGKVVVAVPNQSSFLKYNEENILNAPPHHLTRWTAKSLRALELRFPIKLVSTYKEPLARAHINWFLSTFMKRLPSNRLISILAWKVLFPVLCVILKLPIIRNNIQGHSIMAVFERTK